MISSKCIIDNWSLEHAGILLNNSTDILMPDDNTFQNSLGGLSNYINALLLYEAPGFLKNGFENHWTRFEWFEQNTSLFLNPINPSIANIDWNNAASYSDNGISNYLITSELFDTDLFISPERSIKIIEGKVPRVDDNLITTLKKVDDLILNKKDESWYKDVRIGIENNFQFPSLTQYVFSQASSKEDLLTVIMQLKSDGKITRIKEKINEINSDTKTSMKFQKEIEHIISDSFGFKNDKEKSWSISISVLFLSLSKSFGLNFFKRKEHLVFLKNIAGLRAENHHLYNDIERLFNRKIKMTR